PLTDGGEDATVAADDEPVHREEERHGDDGLGAGEAAGKLRRWRGGSGGDAGGPGASGGAAACLGPRRPFARGPGARPPRPRAYRLRGVPGEGTGRRRPGPRRGGLTVRPRGARVRGGRRVPRTDAP